jgi:hypothetical protein
MLYSLGSKNIIIIIIIIIINTLQVTVLKKNARTRPVESAAWLGILIISRISQLISQLISPYLHVLISRNIIFSSSGQYHHLFSKSL